MEVLKSRIHKSTGGNTRVEFECWDDQAKTPLVLSVLVPSDPRGVGYGQLSAKAYHLLNEQLAGFQAEIQFYLRDWEQSHP